MNLQKETIQLEYIAIYKLYVKHSIRIVTQQGNDRSNRQFGHCYSPNEVAEWRFQNIAFRRSWGLTQALVSTLKQF